MAQYTLTVLDISQIQRYVFSSNRLQENVGASELVEKATRQWVYETLHEPHNVGAAGTLMTERIEDGRLAAEVIYAGGGNTLILFRSSDLAVDFTRALTRKVLIDAPGLELVVAHREFNWDRESLALIARETLSHALTRKKQDRFPSMPLLGLGVTAACASTGLVATDANKDGQLVSREIQAKRDIQSEGRNRFTRLLPDIEGRGWEIPVQLDDLGRVMGEESYIAVVHADGNGMGKRVEQIALQHVQPRQNREYILAMRGFSEGVQVASQEALRATATLLLDALESDKELPYSQTVVPGRARTQKWFPFRPIVFGGDDVTFVCNGKYGLALAARYLKAFQEKTRNQPAFHGEAAHACAGVAVVKVHYPFARAYRLSEALCRSAKQFVKKQARDCSALDWHFAMSGISGSLDSIRQREYRVAFDQGKYGSLEMRPVLLDESRVEWRSWPVVKRLLGAFTREEWRDSRNKVKALREVLRTGPEAVQEFLRTYRLQERGLPGAESISVSRVFETGWEGHSRCVYFDAIEAMDFYVDLEEATKGAMRGNLQVTL